MKNRTHGLHPARALEKARAAFVLVRGLDEVPARQAAIDALERKDWKGRLVFRLQCTGTTGRGPHVVFVPESMLWALIDLRGYLCPFHLNAAGPFEGDVPARQRGLFDDPRFVQPASSGAFSRVGATRSLCR